MESDFVLTPRTATAIGGSEKLLRYKSMVVFKKFDLDGNGTISHRELRTALSSLHKGLALPPPSETEVLEAMADFDRDFTGSLDADQFVDFFRSVIMAHLTDRVTSDRAAASGPSVNLPKHSVTPLEKNEESENSPQRTGLGSSPSLRDFSSEEEDRMRQSCSGPLALIDDSGSITNVYAAILGPSQSSKWVFGMYNSREEHDQGNAAIKGVGLLRVSAVSPDVEHAEVFVISFTDEQKVSHLLTLKAVDRGRDVWVDMLNDWVARAHEMRKEKKATRKTEDKEKV